MSPSVEKPRGVRVGDVARLAVGERLSLSVSESQRRKGPYPLYAENCAVRGIDDYTIEAGGTVMVAAYGQILGSDGRVMAYYEPGRCAATEHVHALVPHDRADARYLWRMVGASPRIAHMVGGTHQLRQLSAAALLGARIPWPEREVREAVVAELDETDRRVAELEALVPALLAEGDATYRALVLDAAGSAGETLPAIQAAAWRQGTDVPAARRGAEKPVRVEGPRGSLGRCDEELTEGAAVLVGAAGRKLLAHYATGPLHPIAELRFADASTSELPLSVLLFALRAAGLPDRPTHTAGALGAATPAPAAFDALGLPVGTPETRAAFESLGQQILDRLVAAEKERAAVAAARAALLNDLAAHGMFHGQTLVDVEPPRADAQADPAAQEPPSPDSPTAPSGEALVFPNQVAGLLSSVIEAVAAALPDRCTTVYLPCSFFEGTCDLVARTVPETELATRFAAELPPDSALVQDARATEKAPLVVATLPPAPGAWSTTVPDATDPRWQILGLPARNKSGYAWLQHALAHQAPGGATVLLVENSLLHTTVGCEKALRQALASSGRVHAAVSLPARALPGEPLGWSILVLGDARPEPAEAPCLMVNLLDCGAAAPTGDPARVLPATAAEHAAQVCRSWFAGSNVPAEQGFSRVVARWELTENDGLLTPWSYV